MITPHTFGRLSAAFLLASFSLASAQTFSVSNTNATGAGSLHQAILDANGYGGAAAVNFTAGLGAITLAGELPILTNTAGITINGNGNTIDGGSTSNTTGYRVFFVGVGAGEAAVSPGLAATTTTNWAISNLTIRNANARGGNGSGGGAGLGGGIFVNAGNLSLSGMSFTENRAVGGNGIEAQGGGGMGGNGQLIWKTESTTFSDAGGGGFGIGADAATTGAGNFANGAEGGYGAKFRYGLASTLNTGGANGGAGGGAGNLGGGSPIGGGGGVGGQSVILSSNVAEDAGDGGFGGGGGGGLYDSTILRDGGDGGYGGGGGLNSGAGGFGGGGGAEGFAYVYQGASGGFGGGHNGAGAGPFSGGYTNFIGGGGLGAGGAVFVRQGASVTFIDGGISGGSVTGGTGINNGSAFGSGVFLAGGANFSVSAGNTVTIADTIGGGVDDLITGGLTKSGAGTLALTGINTYVGGTNINGGVLVASSPEGFGDSPLIAFGGGALGYTNGNTRDYSAFFSTAAGQAYSVDTNGLDISWDTALTSSGSTLSKHGEGTLTLTRQGSFGGTTGIHGGILNVATDTSISLSGATSGAGQLSKSGTGTLSTDGSLAHTGGTTINGGTLVVAGSIAEDVTNNGTLEFDSDSSQTFLGYTSGTGVLAKSGAGTLTLSGQHLNTGGVLINEGSLLYIDGEFPSEIAGHVTNNANFHFNKTTNTSFFNSISGTGSVTKSGAETLRLLGATTYTGATTVNAGSLYLYSSLAGDIANHSLLGAGGSADIVFGGEISGAGQFEKFGDGNLSLTGANTFTGTTAINGGTLTLDSAGGLGASGTLSFGGGTLKHSAQNTADHSSRFSPAAGQAYSIDTNGQNVSWSTALTGVGGSLAKLGDGNLSLNAANAFSGGITINGGNLALSNAGSIGTTGDIVFSGGALQYSANNDTDYSSRFSNTVAQAYSVDTNGRDVTWAADLNPRNIVSLDGSLIKTGTGTLTLTGENSYAGTTTVNAGTLSIGNGGTSGQINGDIINNAAIRFDRSDFDSLRRTLSGSGSFVKTGAGQLSIFHAFDQGSVTISEGTLSFSDVNVSSDILNNANLRFNSSENSIYSGAASGTGAVLVGNSLGKTIFTGENTYSGGTTVGASGTLIIGNGGSIAGNISSSGTVGFDRSDNVTFAGNITDDGKLVKDGTGSVTLSGINNFSAGTTVNEGALTLGSLSALGSTGTIFLRGGALKHTAQNTRDYSSRFDDFSTYSVDTNGQEVTWATNLIANQPLTKSGEGTLTLTGWKPFGAGTTINGGTLAIGDGGTTGQITGNVTNNGSLRFDRSDAVAFAGEISGSGSLIHAGGGLLTLSGASSYSGSTQVATGTIDLTGSLRDTAIQVTGVGAFTQAPTGSISGTSSLFMDVATSAFTTLGGTNTYTGATQISEGRFKLTGSMADTAITLSNFASLTQEASGVISGAASLTLSGTSTASLAGENSYTGGTNINGLRLELLSEGALGASGTISFGGGQLRHSAANTADYSTRFSNAAAQAYSIDTNGQDISWAGDLTSDGGTLAKSGVGKLTLLGANSFAGGTAITQGTLAIRGGMAGDTSIGLNSILELDLSGTHSYSGGISGEGSLSKLGAGTQVFSGTSTLTGGSTVRAGVLKITGTLAGPTLVDGGEIRIAAPQALAAADVTLNPSGAISFDGVTMAEIGGISGTGNIVLQNGSGAGVALAVGGVINNNPTGGLLTRTFAGNLSGAGSLTKAGTGILSLSGTNTHIGGTAINGGFLSLDSAEALGTAGTISFGGGYLLHTAANATDYSSRFSAADNQSFVVNTGDREITWAGSLSSTNGSLTVGGEGKLTLTGSNSYTGTTKVFGGGILQFGNRASLYNADTANWTEANLDFGGTAAFNVGGAGEFTADDIGSLLALGTANGGFRSNSAIGFDTTNASSGEFIYDRVIANPNGGANSISLSKFGSGTLVLTEANTFSGDTKLEEGTLRLGNLAALPNRSDISIGTTATLDLGGNSMRFDEMTGGGSITNSGAAAVTLTIGADDPFGGGFGPGNDASYSGDIGESSGALSLSKVGSNRITLTGSSYTYTGDTTVSAGSLSFSGGNITAFSSGKIHLNNFTNMSFNNTSALSIAGDIDGNGRIISNAGKVTLSGQNS